MARWKPRNRERLQRAALELFTEDGYASTTAAAIAERAGFTERTFYRHFKDKREVLFDDGDRLEQILLDALRDPHPPGTALHRCLCALAQDMEPRRERLARRAIVIESTPELAERELWKLRSWARALSRALIEQGVEELAAVAHVEIALALFRTAFTRWVHSDGSSGFVDTLERTYAAADR